MEYRRLGRLEHRSSVLLYGAAALAAVDQDTADQSIQEALDAGINHFDAAASYGDAELKLAPWMPRIRDRIFLATKTGEREGPTAWSQINRSLERLQTGRVDLVQLHSVGDLDDLDRVMAPSGALSAALRAVDEGFAGAVGITGHGRDAPAVHLDALRRYPFATVLTPLNPVLWRDPAYRGAFERLADVVREQDAALMIIKAISRRNWPHGPDGAPYTTWYEPLADPQRIRGAVSWVLAHEEITGLATASDVRLLSPIIAAERDRMPVNDAESMLATDPDYSSPFVSMPF